MMNNIQQQRQHLRKQLRQQRRSLSTSSQQQHTINIERQLRQCTLFKRSKRIAAYLAADGEIDPTLIIETARRANKAVYLPVLAPFSRRLYFAPYHANSQLKLNHYQIAEPDVHPGQWLKPQQLDLILMPLVGFDIEGNRLGMGGGYYDRSLSFFHFRKNTHSPHLIGLAHQLQCIEKLPHQSHDVPMQMIATEQQLFFCK
jgi:5-formyltetrahydrofolate cyclo-ligase